MTVQTRMKKHHAVWRFAPLSATFTASPSSWLRCLEAVRRRETKLLPHTPTYILYAFTSPTCPHTCTADTFTSRSPSVSRSVSRSVSVTLTSVGASTCWKEEKCWQLSSPDLSPNNFVTLRCQLNSQIHLSQMSFNFHTSPTCYSLESFYFRAHPRCTGSLAVSISLWQCGGLELQRMPLCPLWMYRDTYYDNDILHGKVCHLSGNIHVGCNLSLDLHNCIRLLLLSCRTSHWIRQSHNNPFFFSFFALPV